jgi:hypothetical protein
MAAAVDWLDAYRAGDIESILQMYADDAVIHCGCGEMKTIVGKQGLRAYWVERLRDYPASDLDNLQQSEDGTVISYVARDGVVSAALTFNAAGQIASLSCGPAKGYRAYFLQDGHITGRVEIFAADDAEAVQKDRQYLDNKDIEEQSRRVAVLKHKNN